MVQIFSPFDFNAFSLENFNRFVVTHSWIRVVGVPCNEVKVPVDGCKFFFTFLEHRFSNVSNDALAVNHNVGVVCPSHFHLCMPELRQVPSGAGILSSERGGNGVEAFKGRHGSFGVKLPGLSQVHFLIGFVLILKVGDFEQC